MRERRDIDTIDDAGDTRSLAGINFILGIWLLISPWVLNYMSSGQKWNTFGFGVAIAVLAAIRYVFPSQTWASWLNGVIGLWMIISPWAVNTAQTAAYWNNVIVGIVLAVLAFSNMQYYGHHHHRTTA